jgi:mRNA-degrading endonuclease RelE of RelBE toxin-antitoxin system
MDINVKLANPCEKRRDFCINCHSHFMALRPSIKTVVVSKHFIKDLKGREEPNSLIQDILDCSHLDFAELHKFEEHVDGVSVFRAKKDSIHIVYCVDKQMRIIFLRAFRNFAEYKEFLDKRNEVRKMVSHL